MVGSGPRMQSIHKLFGSRVRQLREEQQLGAADVAALIGCDVSHYYAIERGTHPPSFALLVAIAKTFKVDEADLFTWPGSGVRHELREQVRLASPHLLGALKSSLGHALTAPARPPGAASAPDAGHTNPAATPRARRRTRR
jgi:transcriptional regulator with XRE-family HTH domain